MSLLVTLRCWLGALALMASTSAAAFVVTSLPNLAEQPLSIEACEDFLGGRWANARIDAPVMGWDGKPLAITVSGAGVDLVRISQGGRVYCGRFGDAESMDSRFRTGVGGVLVPPPGGSEPVEIHIHGVDYLLWPAVIVHGLPAMVQKVDAQRFAFRAGVLAITLSIVVSSLLAFFVSRDLSLALFALNSLMMSSWIALLTGLSGFPQAWLPTGELRVRLLMVLPVMVAIGLAYPMVMHRAVPLLRGGSTAIRAGFATLAAFGLSALVVPITWLSGLSLVAEYAVILVFVALAMTSAASVLSTSRSARGTLLACLPISVVGVLALVAPGWIAPWKIEAYIACAAWISVSGSAMSMLRLGGMRVQRDEMRVLAETDSLTGLSNRRGAMARLETEVLRSEASNGKPGFGLIFVDIDHFKRINDSFGHGAGDRVLCAVANLLRQLVRTTDVVARIGGDEFLLILPGADPQATLRLAESIRERIETLPLAGSGPEAPLSCTASLGVLYSRDHPKLPAGELLRRADDAMYVAKRAGRNRVSNAV